MHPGRTLPSVCLLTLLAACTSSSGDDDGGASTSTGAPATDSEADASTGETGAPCVEDPKEPVELLNACSDASCEPFANTVERLPLLQQDGTLPPLP